MANKNYMTSEDLLNSIKRRGNIPDTQDMITDNEILEFANEEMSLNLIPLVYSKHEDYYLTHETIPLVSGKTRYPIPYRSIGTKVREIGYTTNGEGLSEMRRISVDDVTTSPNYTDSVKHYYFEGEEIVLLNSSSTNLTGSLVVFYHMRPNALVLSERVGIITGFTADPLNADRTVITLKKAPENFVVGNSVDFLKTKSPHRVVSFDVDILEVNTNSNYFSVLTAAIPESIVIGDRVASSGETDILNVPSEFHVLLAQMTVERVLEAIGDTEGLKNAAAKLQKMEQNSSLLLVNRAIGSPTKIRVRNGTIGNTSGINRRRF